MTENAYPPTSPPDVQVVPTSVNGTKLGAGVIAIILGYLGIHKFLLGYTWAGLIMLLGSLLTCGTLAFPFWIIGIIEGVTYLTKSDADFHRDYIVGRRSWL